MRRAATFLALALTALVSGCGSKFDLPTERKAAAPIPSDKQYAHIATWKGMDNIQDILMTQGTGSQLFMLFNPLDTTDHRPPSVARGDVRLYPFTLPTPIGPPYFRPLLHMFNPIALASAQSKIFVLDQGDSCVARYDIARGTCEADSRIPSAGHPDSADIIRNYDAVWRLREYALRGGDTISTFTDTTFSQVYGVAADEDGFVYISGIAALLDTSKINQQDRTRKFASRVFRYARGPRYAGIVPGDINMPGSNWHRDTSWVVFDGTGSSSVSDPRGIVWSNVGLPSLFIADKGNDQAKSVSVNEIGVPIVKFDGRETGSVFNSPEDVAEDLQGFFYVVDRLNRRVVRYDPSGNYLQLVNKEPNADNLPLLDPVTVGVDDSVAYIGDKGRGQVIRYKRRP
jgi:hypothetical protein